MNREVGTETPIEHRALHHGAQKAINLGAQRNLEWENTGRKWNT